MKKLTFFIAIMFLLGTSTKGQLTIQNNAFINETGGVSIILQDIDLVNNGTFNSSNGSSVVLKEGANATAAQTIGGSGTSTFENIKVERNNFDAKLNNSIDVNGTIEFVSGLLDLNGNNITLAGTGMLMNETETARLTGTNGGYITKTADLNNPSAANIGNLGAEITSAANLGSTTIKRGHRPKTLPAGNAFQRYFEITPTNNSGLNATLRFVYFDNENPSITEANLELWKLSSPQGWTQETADSQNVMVDFLEKTGIDGFSTWTLAGDQMVDNDGDGLSLLQGDCDDGNVTAVMDTILNNNPIVENYYIVSNQITSAGTIQSNEIMTFQAGVGVLLQPGFIANQGTDFRAFILSCGVPPAPLNVITENEIIENKEEAIKEIEVENIVNEKFNYQVFPNPMQDRGYVNLMLEKESQVEILLFNHIGQLAKTILPQQIQAAGNHQIEYQLLDKTTGVYFVRILMNGNIFTEKIIVSNE